MIKIPLKLALDKANLSTSNQSIICFFERGLGVIYYYLFIHKLKVTYPGEIPLDSLLITQRKRKSKIIILYQCHIWSNLAWQEKIETQMRNYAVQIASLNSFLRLVREINERLLDLIPRSMIHVVSCWLLL